MLTETATNAETENWLDILGYTKLIKSRVGMKGGGLAIFFNNYLHISIDWIYIDWMSRGFRLVKTEMFLTPFLLRFINNLCYLNFAFRTCFLRGDTK